MRDNLTAIRGMVAIFASEPMKPQDNFLEYFHFYDRVVICGEESSPGDLIQRVAFFYGLVLAGCKVVTANPCTEQQRSQLSTKNVNKFPRHSEAHRYLLAVFPCFRGGD